MIPVLLILIPLVTGLISFFLSGSRTAKNWSLLASVATLAVALAGVYLAAPGQLSIDAPWLPALGARFTLGMDGMSQMLSLLTALGFPLIFWATYPNTYSKPGNFYGLMLLSQAGLLGVFLANDALLFYFFWELALIPVYFLCSAWGGEKRIPVTFKFFVYTFTGSLLLLIGILYLYFHNPAHSFSIASLVHVQVGETTQRVLFCLFFLAFAIKMPVFPFHTWQPDAYEQSPTAVTMVMSGIMVKMGVFALVRWLLPLFPQAAAHFSQLIIALSIAGMLYASLIAMRQDDIKRLIAYSSIAHIGLMSAAVFVRNITGLEGVMVQMFNHGINVIGLWILADVIERQLGTRKFSELGGMAHKAPALAIFLVVMALANIALPLTNAFIGEFLMFNGLFQYQFWAAAVAGISIILAAVYTLRMVQQVLYGPASEKVSMAVEMHTPGKWVLAILVVLVLVLGVYPQPLIRLTSDTVRSLYGY